MTPLVARIRPLTSYDLQDAASIHRAAFDWEAWDKKSLGEVLDMPGAAGLIAVDPIMGDLRPLGFLLYLIVSVEAELLTIAVAPGARRRGIGTALIESLMSTARSHGATQLLLEVADDNPGALRLYSRLGFKIEGQRRNYYKRPGNRRADAKLLRRTIVSG